MHFNLGDVDIRTCRNWFVGSWVLNTKTGEPVKIIECNRDQTVIIEDLSERPMSLPFSSIDPFVPELGYIEYSGTDQTLQNSRGSVVRGRGKQNAVEYFYNGGARNYQRGLCPRRVRWRGQIFSISERGHINRVHSFNNQTPGSICRSTSWLKFVFSPTYRSTKEINELGLASAALSKNFALKRVMGAGHTQDEIFSLFYKGYFVAPVSYDYKVRLSEKTNFLRQRIQEELNDVQIIGL